MTRVSRGQIIRARAHFPPQMLTSARSYSRRSEMLTDMGHWNAANAALLDGYGLRIDRIQDSTLQEGFRHDVGDLEDVFSMRAHLAAALPALAAALRGRGDLLAFPEGERGRHEDELALQTDLRAASAELAVLASIADENPGYAFMVRAGQQYDMLSFHKPGEGFNAALFPGQLIVNRRYLGRSVDELRVARVRVCNVATDAIDGVRKALVGEHSALTALLVVDGEIAPVPAHSYMEKVILAPEASTTTLTTNSSIFELAQGVSNAHGVGANQINNFVLDRERHPIEQILATGVNVIKDWHGDLMPAIAPSARPGVYENGLPLHTVFGNAGKGPEFLIAGAANVFLGGESHAQFVGIEGMSNKGWEDRHTFTVTEERAVKDAGLEVGVDYPVSRLVDLSSGFVVIGGVTPNAHFPLLRGVEVGKNHARVDVFKIGASGSFTRRRLYFLYESVDLLTALFDPVIETLLRCSEPDIRGEVRKILADSRRAGRLQREVGLYLWKICSPRDSRFSVNTALLNKVDTRTKKIVSQLTKLAPDWFV